MISGGKIFRPMKMLVFSMFILFLIFLGLGVKFSRSGKNSLGGIKIHQVSTQVRQLNALDPTFDIYNSIFCVLVYLGLCYKWP